jgi:CCR4-NOT transcription complex subunit 9
MTFSNGWPASRTPGYQPAAFPTSGYHNRDYVSQLVKRLTASPADRSEALHTLSVQREQIPELAIFLWESPATITALLTEILSIYPHLATTSQSSTAPTSLNSKLAARVCNVLALFQCVAGCEETRLPFIRANIPMYLFPFLHATNQSRECECFKLTSLGILGSLVKAENPDIIDYLLQNEFVPLCLRILKFGQEMSKIVAAFIVQKILSDPNGRQCICSNPERRETVLKVLNLVLRELAQSFSPRLSKNVVASYQQMLDSKEVVATVRAMELPVLGQSLAPNCNDDFSAFIAQLKAIKNGVAPVRASAQPLTLSRGSTVSS